MYLANLDYVSGFCSTWAPIHVNTFTHNHLTARQTLAPIAN
jgi:hypothetical protein